MATRGVRLGITGATGALGTEVLAALDVSRLPIVQLVAVAGADSLGRDIEFQGEVVPVVAELPALHGLDLLLNCAPPAAAPDIARAALRAEVPCIDLSGVFAQRSEVPLGWAAGGDPVAAGPLLASPIDAALVWLPVLRSLAEIGPLAQITGTILESASASGGAGIEALSLESMALFNQQELPERDVQLPSLAFDCHATSGELVSGRRTRELALSAVVARMLSSAPAVSARWIQVPVFVGQISSLVIAWERPVDPAEATLRLAKAAGIELWDGVLEAPNLRAVSGRDVVVASRPESDAARSGAVRLWAAGDVLRLAAANAVALAVGLLSERSAREARGAH